MAKNPRVEKFMRRGERNDNRRTRKIIGRMITPNAPLTKEAKKTILSAKKEDNENEVANFN